MTTKPAHASVAFNIAAFLVAALFFLLLCGQVDAHAVLVSPSPSQGERLAKAPSTFTLHFSEPVTRVALTLTDRFGRSRELEVTTSGADVMGRLNKTIDEGAYALNWRAVSADGHPVRAAVVFSVGPENGIQDLQHLVGDHADTFMFLTWLLKVGYYTSVLFGVGGAFFAFWIGGAPPGRGNGALLWTACLCGFASLGLLGVEETGSSLAGLISTDAWAAAIDGSFARSITLAAVSLLLSFMAIVHPGRGRSLSVLSILMIGPAFALTGHASESGTKWLSVTALSVHVVAVCFWAGALPRLWMILRPGQRGQSVALRRFSTAIPYAVAAIVVPGAYLAAIEIGIPEALWRTAYGNVLSAKLALVVCALLLGAFNRLFLTKGVAAGSEASARLMKRIVCAEVVLIALVLCVTALFRFTPPPRALSVQAPIYTSVHLHDPAAMATASFWTRPDLRFDVEVSLADAAFNTFDPREVTLKMSSADGSVAPFLVPIRRKAMGLWRADHVQAPCDCDWKVRVEVLVTDFDMVDLDGKIKLTAGE